jgi:hypothetical protein
MVVAPDRRATMNTPTAYDPDTRKTAIFVGLMFLTATATFLAGDQLVLGALKPPGASGNTMHLSIGAGLYEELLFRVVVVSALANGARLAFGWGRGGAGIIATILGALDQWPSAAKELLGEARSKHLIQRLDTLALVEEAGK